MIITIRIPVFIVFFILFFSPQYSNAESLRPTSEVDYIATEQLPAKQAKQIIRDIVNSDDLKTEKKSKQWKIRDIDIDKLSTDTPDWMKALSLLFAKIIEYTLWILLLIALLTLYLTRNQWLFLFTTVKEKQEEYQVPEILFGMDVREESLPDDIIAEALLLWQQQQVRKSLSLLYRGALVHLLNTEKLPLENSHTEGDILKQSKKTLAENKHHYLIQLTTQWQLIAYAHRIPNNDRMEWLFSHWEQDFSSVRRTQEDA